MHWLREILDEGHMLGASLQMTNKLSMAINLKAERRWIMTGGTSAIKGSCDQGHHLPSHTALLEVPSMGALSMQRLQM